MEFIIDETEVENNLFSDESDNECISSDEFFTDDEETVAENDKSFYRSFDNKEEFHQFKNQIKNPEEEHKRSSISEFYGEDDLPEMFLPEDREHVEFGASANTKERAANFKKTLKLFESESIENHFFYSVIMVSFFKKQKNQTLILSKKL